jgi:hypothetical protein
MDEKPRRIEASRNWALKEELRGVACMFLKAKKILCYSWPSQIGSSDSSLSRRKETGGALKRQALIDYLRSDRSVTECSRERGQPLTQPSPEGLIGPRPEPNLS